MVARWSIRSRTATVTAILGPAASHLPPPNDPPERVGLGCGVGVGRERELLERSPLSDRTVCGVPLDDLDLVTGAADLDDRPLRVARVIGRKAIPDCRRSELKVGAKARGAGERRDVPHLILIGEVDRLA